MLKPYETLTVQGVEEPDRRREKLTVARLPLVRVYRLEIVAENGTQVIYINGDAADSLREALRDE